MSQYFGRLSVSALLVASISFGALHAQEAYPNRPIRLIVPSAPGGLSDAVARIVGGKLSAALSQPVVIDNKPGANSIVAIQGAANAAPDGYTIMYGYTAFNQNLALRTDSPYRASEFVPVSQLVVTTPGFFVPESLGVKTIGEFMALARAAPKKYTIGNSGVGSSGHIIAEIMAKTGGLDAIHVPYKSEAAGLNELLSGQISAFSGGSLGTFMPHVRSGKLKILAIAGDKRSPLAASVPTWTESGLTSANFETWTGIFVPAGTPNSIVMKLSNEVSRIVRSPDVSRKLEEMGARPVGSSSAAFASYLENDLKRWVHAAKSTQIKLE